MAATWAGNVGLIAWRPETLTETPSAGSICCCQVAVWAHACSSTCSPSAAIRPVSSAIGMNSSGGIRPRSGCVQRASASVDTGRPVARSITGWYQTSSSPRSSARRSSVSVRTRFMTLIRIASSNSS